MSRYPIRRAALAESSSSAKRPRNRPSTCSIDALPSELLARIFHELRWQDRLELEIVCRRWREVAMGQGWSDVKGFTIDACKCARAAKKYSAALQRCGDQLQWLNALDVYEPHLGLCPNVRHLRLGEPDQSLGNSLGSLYAGRLKSLSFCGVSYKRPSGLPGCYRALLNDAKNSLEFLQIAESRYSPDVVDQQGAGNEADATLFPKQLRCLRLASTAYYVGMPRSGRQFLSSLGDGRFPQLRSLELDMDCAVHLSALQHLPGLEHLALRIHGIVSALLLNSPPHLPNLKSLVMRKGSPTLLKAIVSASPQIEHLGVEGGSGWKFPNCAPQNMVAVLESLGAGLAHLRSLDIIGEQFGWPISGSGWLEAIVERGQLEYLNSSDVRLPACILYKTVEKCRKLRVISSPGQYSVGKMAAAAAANEASRGDNQSLPTIYCHVHKAKWPDRNSGRVVFLDRGRHKAPKSHVLRHYRYGCLSEGKPSWKKIN